jgi:methionyl-tRNA synthetase
MRDTRTIYITTPIYYVNDVPHIGHAYTTIAADVFARYWRLRGRDVFFLTGLDEHGQKVQQAAVKAGIDPQRYCDAMVPRFQELWKRLEISNDAFIRTTDPHHQSIVQRYLQELFDKHLIYKDSYTGWYCTFDERFWTEKDVVDGLCPDCKRPVEKLSEHNYFFKMGRYQDRLIEHIETRASFIRPASRRNEVLAFLQTQKLGDLSISRPKSRLSWGIELPFDKSYVTYVWFDALVNYLSALEYKLGTPAVEKYWPASVHLVGKDILTTHAVYWSTMLMALDLPLPDTIFAHGWWTVNGEKMSKSRGNVVDPNQMVEEFGADAFRYFLLREVPFGQDGDFSRPAMIARINSDLANGVGNLLSRTLTMIEKYRDGRGPIRAVASEGVGNELETQTRSVCDGVQGAMGALQFHRALDLIWSLVHRADEYIERTQPWKLAKSPAKASLLEGILYNVMETLRHITLHLYPFMPRSAEAMARQLGLSCDFSHPLPENSFEWGAPLVDIRICKGAGLFPRIESKPQGANTVSEPSPTPPPTPSAPTPATAASQAPAPHAADPSHITIDEFAKIQLKTAKVLSAERVPKSDKLLKLHVSLGTEQRQIVAGIGKTYEPASLVGKTIVIVANLKPAKLMGIESQGMVLAAGDTDVRGLVTILEDVDPGTKVK